MPSREVSPERYHCMGCGVHTKDIKEFYTLQNHIWRLVNPQHSGMLCIGCVEQRLGRELCMVDFTWCPLNAENLIEGSDRLKNRLLPSYRSGRFDEVTHLRRHLERHRWFHEQLSASTHAG